MEDNGLHIAWVCREKKKKKDTFSKKQLVAGKALCQELSDLNFCVGPVIFMTLDNSHGFSESQFPPENR